MISGVPGGFTLNYTEIGLRNIQIRARFMFNKDDLVLLAKRALAGVLKLEVGKTRSKYFR